MTAAMRGAMINAGRGLPRQSVAVLAAALAMLCAGGPLRAQPPAESREVRQLVTFRFLPGQTRAALDLFRTHLAPIYREVESMLRVRMLGEVESPEPLDLIVVTHYADMAAMDRANRDLRRPFTDHPPVSDLYRQLSELSLGHHDQFVEVLSAPSGVAVPDATLEVLEFLRLTPGSAGAFERIMLDTVHPWEQQPELRNIVVRSETARFLVADGWDYLRTYAVRDLAAWQAYTAARARNPATFQTLRFVAGTKTMILREIADLRVR